MEKYEEVQYTIENMQGERRNVMTLAFIVNPKSGKGLKKFNLIKRQLNIPFRTYVTQYHQHATKLVKHLVKEDKIELLIVVGGDGTINEVINGSEGNKITLGIIGNGSGNDFGRYFKTFKHASEIEAFLRKPRLSRVDLGKVTHDHMDRLFVNSSGIGFDALVCEGVNQSKLKKRLNKVHLGKLSYLYYVFRALCRFKPFELTINHSEGATLFENVWFVTVSNQPYFGGGMKIAPEAVATDGKLDVTIIHHLKKKTFIRLFWSVYKGEHTKYPFVDQLKVDQFSAELRDRQVAHCDGETHYVNGGMPIYFETLQHKFKLAEPMRLMKK